MRFWVAVAAEPEVEVDWRLTSTWPETEPEMVYGEFGIGSLVIGGGVDSAETLVAGMIKLENNSTAVKRVAEKTKMRGAKETFIVPPPSGHF